MKTEVGKLPDLLLARLQDLSKLELSVPGQTLRARFTGDERNTRGRAKGDERERERGSADSEQVSVGSAGMLAEPIRLQQSCDSVLIR